MYLGLEVRPEASPPIGEALSFDALDGGIGAGRVIDAERFAVVVAEVKLGQIA
jgi:hypothetical protein